MARMLRGAAARVVLGVIVGGLSVTVPPAAPGIAAQAEPLASNYANPLVDSSGADPTITRVGNTYYALTTQSGFTNIPVRSSTDLVTWSASTDALPQLGSWATFGNTWAPDLLHRVDASGHGYWVMYYTAHDTTSGDQCIGAAVSYDAPLGGGVVGPYTDGSGAPFVCQTDLAGSIDADAYVPNPQGDNPQAYLFWKSNEAATTGHRSIWSQPLDTTGLSFTAGTSPAKVMTSEEGWENLLVEGPSVYWDPASQETVLLYSGCRFNQVCYATGWATCTGTAFVFTTCTRGQTGVQAEPFMAESADVKGPGGADVFDDVAGNKWLVYHGYKASQCTGTSCSGPRQLRIDRLCMLNGVPRTNGPTAGSQPFSRSSNCLQDVNSFGWGASASGLPVTGGWDIDTATAAKEVTLNGPYPNQSSIFRGNPDMGDQTVKVDAQWAATGTSSHPKYGMLAVFTDWDNHTSVWIDKKNNLFATYAKVGGVVAGFQNTTLPAGFNFSAYHELKVVKTGTTVRYYLDGALQRTRTLSLASGQMGLITEDTRANYRNASQT